MEMKVGQDSKQTAMMAVLLGLAGVATQNFGSYLTVGKSHQPAPVPRKEQKLRMELAEEKRQRRASKLLKQQK